MNLTVKNGILFAVDEEGNFIGKIANDVSGECCDNPSNDHSFDFLRAFSGHGYIFHQNDQPSNPAFVCSWHEIFSNAELLPLGTKNVFVDPGKDAKDSFNAVLKDYKISFTELTDPYQDCDIMCPSCQITYDIDQLGDHTGKEFHCENCGFSGIITSQLVYVHRVS